MTPTIFNRSIAGDAFEYLIENRIDNVTDLYDLDGETFLRSRNGIIETGDLDLVQGGGQ